ncbi:hypothetical protein BCR44DRAFT_44875, partial [Catenaria anguillulae PL171]
MFHSLFLALPFLAWAAFASPTAPQDQTVAATSSTFTKCKSYRAMHQRGLAGLPTSVASTSTDLSITSNMHFDAEACFKWAQENKLYVALVEYAAANAPPGTYRCSGKAVPSGRHIGSYIKPQAWWKSVEYVGPYKVTGEGFNVDVPKSWWALGAQTGLDKCDMYSIEEGGFFGSNRWWPWTLKECTVFPKADERSVLILANECPAA